MYKLLKRERSIAKSNFSKTAYDSVRFLPTIAMICLYNIFVLLPFHSAFTYNDNDINLLHTSNKHVQKGCLESSLCDTLDCGTGTCQITSGVAQCHCNGAGYKGPQCVDICKDSPCNTGTCKHSSSSLSGYVCDCPIGFTGELYLISPFYAGWALI